MRYCAAFILCLLCCSSSLQAQRRYHHAPRTEADIVNSVISCLQTKDTARYFSLFPPFDTLWHMVMHNKDQSPEAQQQLAHLKEHPQTLIEFDPLYNRNIIGRFAMILAKGEDSGIMWRASVLQRYELLKDGPSASLQGYDRIAPERFKGYVFLRDVLTRRTFCLTMTEIQKVNGQFFGGQLLNILEASGIDDFLKKEAKEKQYYEWLAAHPDTATDSTKTDSATVKKPVDDDEDTKKRKEVIDRKYYEGTFDNEIPVKLYIRYMKGTGEKGLTYDGLYRFGDHERYVKLEITINDKGKWMIEDEVPLGVMELTQQGKTYTGTWSNNDDNGYDVVLKEALISQKKIEALDKVLDQGASGRIEEDEFGAQATAAIIKKKKSEDDDSDGDSKADRKKKKEEDQEDNADEKWSREQAKAQKKARKKMKKFHKPKDESD